MNSSGYFPRPWSWLLLAAGAVVLLLVAYGPVLTRGPYGINDDYQYLYRTHDGSFDPGHNELMGMGRPVMAWSVQIAYGLCRGSVAHLVWLRAVAVVAVGVLATLLFQALVRLRYGRGFALTVAALAMLTPACGVYTAWAAGMFAPWALSCALGAGLLLIGRTVDWRRDVLAACLIVLACGNWQASAPLAMFPVLVRAWRRFDGRGMGLYEPEAPPWWRPWLVGGLAVACYGAWCVLTARSGTISAGGVARLSLATDLTDKARFLASVLWSGVTFWVRLRAGPWEWIVGSITVAACVVAVPVQRDDRWSLPATVVRAGLAVFMVLLSVAPLLAVRENNGALRSLTCLYVTVIFLAVQGVRRLLARAPSWTGAVLAVLAVAVGAGVARYQVWHELVEPNMREYVGVRDEIRRQFPNGAPSHVVYLVPPYRPLAPDLTINAQEYGLISSTFWWVTRPFLLLAMADALPDKPVPRDLQISYREAGNPGVPVLQSLPMLLREEGEWRNDPRWGRVRAFRDGWLYSPWFGYFNAGSFPAVWHHILDGLVCVGEGQPGQNMWFYRAGFGTFHTSPEAFPHLLLGENKRWVWLSDDNPSQVYLIDDVTHQRLPDKP